MVKNAHLHRKKMLGCRFCDFQTQETYRFRGKNRDGFDHIRSHVMYEHPEHANQVDPEFEVEPFDMK